MATDRQQAYALINHFLKRYNKAYGVNPPGFNRHSVAYGFEGLVKDYPGMGKEIIDYYFDNWKEPDPVRFTYDYGKVVVAMDEAKADERERREIRRMTIERMKRVTDSSQSDQSGNQE